MHNVVHILLKIPHLDDRCSPKERAQLLILPAVGNTHLTTDHTFCCCNLALASNMNAAAKQIHACFAGRQTEHAGSTFWVVVCVPNLRVVWAARLPQFSKHDTPKIAIIARWHLTLSTASTLVYA